MSTTAPAPAGTPAPPVAKQAATARYEVFREVKLEDLIGDGDVMEGFSGVKELLIPVGMIHARTQEDACWAMAESDNTLRAAATSKHPPKLRAGNAARGGLSRCKPYALESTTRRKS